MPVVTIETVGRLTVEQKKEIIRQVTQTLVEVAHKPASAVYVRIEEVSPVDFGVGGEPLG